MKNITNKLFIIASCFAAVTSFSACEDWTEVESVTIQTPGVDEQNPEEYAKYIQNLNTYKNASHKIVYAWFDNSEKVPFSRGQHITDTPDSLDVISMMHPGNLAEYELTDMQTVRQKGTKVVYTISFDKIQQEYTEKVKEGTLTNVTLEAYLTSETYKSIGYADAFDGIIAEYKGNNPIYMSSDEKAEAKKLQDYFFGAVSTWKSNNADKLLTFQGYPENLIGQTILTSCKHIILVTDNVANATQLSVVARKAMIATNIPSDRFVVAASTTSLDAADKQTGYYGADRALIEAAYWITEPSTDFTKAGLAIYNLQNDYYNANNSYQYVKKAINIMNPAPKK